MSSGPGSTSDRPAIRPRQEKPMKRVRQRASYSKSRKGCDSCKQRHQKCDETFPVCLRCARLGLTCRWDRVPSHSSERVSSDFRVVTPAALRIARLENDDDVHAFEYFHLYTLPTIRMCQPSALWTTGMGFFGQRNSTLRAIAVALGLQQRLLQTDRNETSYDLLEQNANLLYCKALKSLRQSISTPFAEDEVSLTLACLFLCLLESLRNSPAGMLPHLGCGTHLLSRMKPSLFESDEVQALSASLQAFSLNSRLFCFSSGYNGEFPAVSNRIRVRRAPRYIEGSISYYSQEISSVIQETVQLLEDLRVRGSHERELHQNPDAVASLVRFEHRVHRMRQSIEAGYNWCDESRIQASCILAGCYLSETLIREKLDSSSVGSENHISHYRRIVELVEYVLTHPLSTSPANTRPFAFGLNTIQLLDVTITHCSDVDIRKRALDLLDLCPEREGMWRSAVAKQYLQCRLHRPERIVKAGTDEKPETHISP